MPSLLVGIATRNRAPLVSKAIRSALSQRGINTRVAVVDDGSTDTTKELKEAFPEVDWVRWAGTHGYMKARNYLMRSATEEYFVSLDDDAWFLNGDELSVAVNYLEQNPTVAAIAFDILSPDKPDPSLRGTPRPVSMFIGCGHVVRLAALRNVGFYEELPGPYGGEEKDLCLRLIDANYQIAFLPGVHVWHEKTAIERHTPDQHRSGVCNDLVMTLRRTPLWLLPVAMLSKSCRHLVFSVRHRLTATCLEGFGLFLRSIPRVWSSRKPVKTSALRKFIQLRSQ